MEKICEFCTALRPVVYCKADAAHLCLSCDARVHSANALSGRHFRTLLCQSCRNRPAYVRCINHEMFICRNCDRTLHGFSSQHDKRLLKTYMGCPSAKEFAVLWGFDLNLLDNFGSLDWFVSSTSGSVDKRVFDLISEMQFSAKNSSPSATATPSSLAGYSKVGSGSSSQQRGMNQRRDPQQDNNDILQQILGLKRLQRTDQTNNPSYLRGKEQAEFLSTVFETSQKLEVNLDSRSENFPDISNDLQAMDISHQGLREETCCSPFSQLEQLASPATIGTLTNGDVLWQWKSPAFGSQEWSENMQDLGFCEEFECFDDIPDVDPTFRNIEDLFGSNQDSTGPFIDNEDMFSVFENASQDVSEDEYAKYLKGASASSSNNYAQPESPDFFSRQLSLSRLSTESSFNDIEEDGVSPILTTKGDASTYSGIQNSDGTQTCSLRYKDEKKNKNTRKNPLLTPNN